MNETALLAALGVAALALPALFVIGRRAGVAEARGVAVGMGLGFGVAE